MLTHRPPAGPAEELDAGRLPLELPAVAPPELDDEAPRQLSVLRVLVALLVLGGAAYGVFAAVRAHLTAAVGGGATWFAPYVDVTATPTYQFQSPSNDPARQTVLGFVVAAGATSCVPSWGAAYGLAAAGQDLALTARIAQLQSNGATPIVSFGGQKHTSLAVACPTPQALEAAYQSVLDTYHVHTIDLDIEGPALNSFTASQRRAAALRLLEQAAAGARQPLRVWVTLPVDTNGLQDNALSVLRTLFRDRVRLAGIDVMAMDFRTAPATGQSMAGLVEQSLAATHAQLARLLPRYGIHLRPDAIWHKMGVTVMLGQNNIVGERLTVHDAVTLRAFAQSTHLGRVSMWSLNRDAPCAAGYGLAVLSTTCSGTAQADLEFTGIFDHLSGSAAVAASGTSGSTAQPLRPVAPDTNPSNAPFPAWSPSASYVAGYKVVENGEIYQAKWYNSAQDPSAQYQYAWQSPWELLGPVLPGDHAPVIPGPAPGMYPSWQPSTVYVAGQRVVFRHLGYQARWSNQGVAPGIDAALQPSSPWRPLYEIPGEPPSGS